MNARTINQLRYYHKLVNQLHKADYLVIQVETQQYQLRPRMIKRDDFRYLLKMMDIELRCVNEITPTQKNKIDFTDATIDDLNQHISWIIEQLWSNNIIPFDVRIN